MLLLSETLIVYPEFAPRIKVFIADDSPDARYGIASNLRSCADFDIFPAGITRIEEANRLPRDIGRTLEMLRACHPDVAVMDIKWGSERFAGIEAARQLKEELPRCRVILYSNHVEREQVLRAVLEGRVDGYISKEQYPSYVLPDAIRTVYRGLPYFVPEVVERLLAIIRAPEPTPEATGEPLSESELAVLKRIASGESNAAIADKLNYTRAAIKSKAHDIYEKLGISDETAKGAIDPRVMAILRGLQRGDLNLSDLTPSRPG